jgi:hypothetical protein
MKPRSFTHRHLALGLLALAGLLPFAPRAHAQADYTASRPAELFAFGGYTHVSPDYGPDGVNNTGLVFGADYARSFGWRFVPALEVRANINSGQVVTEHTYLVGLRAAVNFHQRYHPYANFLIGPGYITYPEYIPPTHITVSDEGLVYSYGAGIDVDIVHDFLFKADFQLQSWNLGTNGYTNPQGGNFTLSPTALTIGVSYRIPFKPWTSHGYETQ